MRTYSVMHYCTAHFINAQGEHRAITNGLHSTVGQGLTRQLRQVTAVLKSFVIIRSAQCEHPVRLSCTVCMDAPKIICYLVAYIYSLLIRLCCCIYTCICIAAVTLRICHRCRRAQSDFQLLRCNGRDCNRWFCNACCNVANTELPCSSSTEKARAGKLYMPFTKSLYNWLICIDLLDSVSSIQSFEALHCVTCWCLLCAALS
jgi:hypothetical protein